ncbi:MAG: peptide-methionine (S)-S-oxide reductase [Chitinophagia bacterium]|nr:peptide-methionine (S)-S-oxide reductase [Chitinophagia bacterium]
MLKNIAGLLALFALAFIVCATSRAHAQMPLPHQTVVVAGGCFWGVQSVFQHTKGVINATSGYVGGTADTAHYERVSNGDTGHAESVHITYDPAQISLDQLLDIYFTVAHNPTELDHQGPDYGTQYRSEIFYENLEQRRNVAEKINALQQSKLFSAPIVTKLEKLDTFYPAEAYHQNFAALHPNNPYILTHDAPKLNHLKEKFPTLYVK